MTPIKSRILKLFCETTLQPFIVNVNALYSPGWKIKSTLKEIQNDEISQTFGPIRVSKFGRGKFFVIDGNHRVIEAIFNGQHMVQAIIDPHIPDITRTGQSYASQQADAEQIVKRVGTPL